MKNYLVTFVWGRTIDPNGNNIMFNRSNVNVPRIGESIQVPQKYQHKYGSGMFTVTKIFYQYMDEDDSDVSLNENQSTSAAVFVWVFVE